METIRKLAQREFQLKELLKTGAIYDDDDECRICFASKTEPHNKDCWIPAVAKELGVKI